MSRLAPCLRLACAVAIGGAPLARPAAASPYAVGWYATKETPEALLERAQRAYDEGRYQESGDLAAAAYASLPLGNRASPYGENAVFAATDAYREAWLRNGDPEALTAARELLQRHVDDYVTRGKSDAPSTVLQEAERIQLLQERVEQGERAEPQPEAEAEAEPQPPPARAPQRSLRRATAAAFIGDAALSLGAVVLSAFVFGYEPVDPTSRELAQVRSLSHLGPAIPLGVVGGAIGGLGMHAWIDGGTMAPRRKQKLGVALTVLGAAAFVAGGVLLGTGAAFWPAAESGVTDRSRANLSIGLQGVGLGTMLGSLGVLGPGIATLATPGRAKR